MWQEGEILQKLIRCFAIMGIVLLSFTTACAGTAKKADSSGMDITQSVFGKMPDGELVTKFVLTNSKGMKASIMTYGGIVTSLEVPDKNGQLTDIVLGYDNLEGYLQDSYYLGALIGRYGNRIDKGRFSIDGQQYQLPTNDGKNHLHGGFKGFDKKNWHGTAFYAADAVGVKMELFSEDGDQNYPGNLTVQVIYTLTNDNVLNVDYSAVTDKPTIINLTQHSYFNLAGKGDILNHQLTIPASHITPVNAGLIPTGELMPVANTPFDFRTATRVGERIAQGHQQLKYGMGYDHNFVLDKSKPDALELAAKLVEPESGRVLEVFSTEPAVQFYSGNFLDGTKFGKGRKLAYRNALCLEPQHNPDSPNHKNFASTILRPGEVYNTTIRYKFSTTK